MKFPNVADVARALRAAAAEIEGYALADLNDGDASADVRLQVYPNGAWAIRVGDASYDTDHTGYWGASSLDPSQHVDVVDLALDLLDQVQDMASADGADDCDGDS